jgi:hypothetical protein
MGEADYKKALEAAEKELAELEIKAEVVTQRRAQLQQTIGALKTLMNISEEEERTITDTIRIVMKAATGYLLPDAVLKNVLAMGVKFSSRNAIASVVTILGRLQKDGELERNPLLGYRFVRKESWRGKTVPPPPGSPGETLPNQDDLANRRK